MSETKAANPLPPYMEKGSRGPAALAVNAFLAGFSACTYFFDATFVVDDIYGERAVALMKLYQDNSGLGSDGGCGPATRAEMKDDGFDFEAVAHALGGTTVFVQLDGSEISWFPGCGSAAEVTESAEMALPLDDGESMAASAVPLDSVPAPFGPDSDIGV